MILWRAGFRYLLRHPLQIVFAVIGVALGVSVVVAIDLANSSAERAFSLSADALVGRTTHMVVGGPSGLPEASYSRNYTPSIDSQTDISLLLTKPGTGLMTKETADSFGIKKGDRLSLTIGNNSYDLTLIGLLETREKVTTKALENLVITDISSAQEMLSLKGFLSRVDLIVPNNSEEKKILDQLRSLLPANAEIIPANTRSKTMAQMTSAFQLNLTALSLYCLKPFGSGSRNVSHLQHHDILDFAAQKTTRRFTYLGCNP
jgi:putative ABC transport system permease protein